MKRRLHVPESRKPRRPGTDTPVEDMGEKTRLRTKGIKGRHW